VAGFRSASPDAKPWSPALKQLAHAWWHHARYSTIGASTVQAAYRNGGGRLKLPEYSDPIFGLEADQLDALRHAGDGVPAMLIDMLSPLDRKVKLPSGQRVTVLDMLLASRDASGRIGPPMPVTRVPMVATWDD